MRMRLSGLLVVLLPVNAWAGEMTVEEIMSRVAANQERAQQLRTAYVYQQEIRARVFKDATKLVREETRRYAATPTAKGTEREQTLFLGRVLLNKELLEYHDPDYRTKEVDLDGELAGAFSEGFHHRDSRDGIDQDWFPLTGHEQRLYRFLLTGRDVYRGRSVYQITFEPKNHGQGTWRGEVLVDQEQFQPVVVVTELAQGIPLWVRTVFGTNVKQVGFKLAYEEFADGVWFPVTYGGEFKIKAFFFYNRTIAVSMVNTGFRRTEVTSRVDFAEHAPPKH